MLLEAGLLTANTGPSLGQGMERMAAIDEAPTHLSQPEADRASHFKRLFRRQMALVLFVIVGLTAVHFALAAGGLSWLETNVVFLAGLAVAAAVLVWSVLFVSREAEASFEALQESYLSAVRALSGALEARDHYTNDHSESVTELVDSVGRRLGMEEAELSALRYASLFHDIGKIGIPDRILNKPADLSAEEWEEMERHTMIGEQILAPLDFMRPALPIVRHEHERWDGRGYPDRLAGEAIPLGARIILACDAFHAMTSDRPYRAALPRSEAGERLRTGAGSQFDPVVVDALLDILSAAEPEAAAVAPSPASSARAEVSLR
ncbi:MAG: HD-GYP domain-containing protein [Solirubrobacterales bacterium]